MFNAQVFLLIENCIMKKFFLLFFSLLIIGYVGAQYQFRAIIKSGNDILPAATVAIKKLNVTAVADTNGIVVIKNIPAGKHDLVFSYVGFEKLEKEFTFPLQNDEIIEIELEKSGEEEDEVFIQSTRTSRTISNIPARIEVISGEELDEKGNMKPGDIRMLLNETTGIQTQQTSATSYNSSIRIQGLDGRYTQILKDGFPLYTGFSSGLSIMQTAPLDLKQVEVIKGSSSTLYGGGAIAGLINLVSKTPKEKNELNFLANAVSAGGVDLSGFWSQKFQNSGITFFVSRNSNAAYDPADIGLTAIPEFERYIINPRLFLYFNKRTTLSIGFSTIWENRVGGSMDYIKNGTLGFFEKNTTSRFTSQLGFEHIIEEKTRFNFKNSFNRFHRSIEIPGYSFEGTQSSTFTEASYDLQMNKQEWIFGINVITDEFNEDKKPGIVPRDYSRNTYGGFIQNTWNASDKLTIESGVRGDFVNDYSFNLLPRVSFLLKINSKLTSRIGGGLGYKEPTVFTEDAERIQFQNVLPVNIDATNIERSAGLNFDINYRTRLFDGEIDFSMNQLFFFTRINRPLVLTPGAGNELEFRNANGYYDTKGIETNIKLIYHDFKLFIGYTYADANSHFNNIKEWLPLTARHRLNNVLMYEVEEKWKLGLEAYFFSQQKLNDGTNGKSYWICGFMAEKLWEKFSLFVNFENFSDTRQTKFDTIFTGTPANPVFRDIYAPVDGFLVNGGIKIKL